MAFRALAATFVAGAVGATANLARILGDPEKCAECLKRDRPVELVMRCAELTCSPKCALCIEYKENLEKKCELPMVATRNPMEACETDCLDKLCGGFYPQWKIDKMEQRKIEEADQAEIDRKRANGECATPEECEEEARRIEEESIVEEHARDYDTHGLHWAARDRRAGKIIEWYVDEENYTHVPQQHPGEYMRFKILENSTEEPPVYATPYSYVIYIMEWLDVETGEVKTRTPLGSPGKMKASEVSYGPALMERHGHLSRGTKFEVRLTQEIMPERRFTVRIIDFEEGADSHIFRPHHMFPRDWDRHTRPSQEAPQDVVSGEL